MNKVVYSLLVAVIALLLGPVAPAAAADTTPPTLTVTSPARFVVGSTIGTSVDPGPTGDYSNAFTSNVTARLQWRGSDASGICGYDVEQVFAGLDPELIASGLTVRQYDVTESDYDGMFGGESTLVVGWQVTAHDCAGNTKTAFIDGLPSVLQQNGASATRPNPVTYTGTWGTSTCSCWSWGTVARTTQAGATVKTTVPNLHADGSPVQFALVMEKAPNRGVARIYVNGVFRTTVDTYSAAAVHRAVVWERLLNPGDVVTVVNAATTGRARIDVDAYLLR